MLLKKINRLFQDTHMIIWCCWVLAVTNSGGSFYWLHTLNQRFAERCRESERHHTRDTETRRAGADIHQPEDREVSPAFRQDARRQGRLVLRVPDQAVDPDRENQRIVSTLHALLAVDYICDDEKKNL